MRVATASAATGITLISLLWALEIFQRLGANLYPGQYMSAILAFALALAFLHLPAKRRTPRLRAPWYDVLLAGLGFVLGWYMTIHYPRLAEMYSETPWDSVVAGLLLVPMMIEALRRGTGNTLPIIVLTFIAYGLLGHHLNGRFAAQQIDWDVYAGLLAFDGNAIPGGPLAIACSIVVAFIFFGTLLNATRGTQFFTDLALVAMGRYRGGSAKIAVAGSAMFGSISGSAVANVVATGVITIPMIKRGGYPAHKAAAIEAVASTGGQLLPPVMGAAAFLMADFLETSYANVVIAALVPGLFYYFALFVQADLEAAREGLAPLKRSEIPRGRTLLPGWIFVVPFAALIFALFELNWQPQTAAILAVAGLLLFSLVFSYRGFRPPLLTLLNTVRATGVAVLDIILIAAGAGVVIGVLSNSGLGFTFTNVLVQLGSGSLLALLVLAAAVCIVLGMGLPTVGVYVLLAALVAPGLVEVGVNPMAAHLYVMYFGMLSMLTPPVAIAAYAAAGIANADPVRTGFASVRFGWLAYVIPFLFVLSPTLILVGETLPIVASLAAAAIGIWLVSVGIIGYFLRRVRPAQRAVFAVSGLLALAPQSAFAAAPYLALGGALTGLALASLEYAAAKAARSSAPVASGETEK